MFSLDPELNSTLCRMNGPHNPANVIERINCQPPPPVDADNQVLLENPEASGST